MYKQYTPVHQSSLLSKSVRLFRPLLCPLDGLTCLCYVQLRSVLEDTDIRGIKTGMLFDSNAIQAITRTLRDHYGTNVPNLVCDPVCVSTSGHTLLQPEAVEDMVKELFPLATLITPNKSEAELILSMRNLPSTIANLSDMLTASEALLTLGPKAVLLKGGHITSSMQDVAQIVSKDSKLTIIRDGLLDENMEILQIAEEDLSSRPLVVDVLRDQDAVTLFIRPRIDSTSTHGTGCTLSAAIVCALGRGVPCTLYCISFEYISHSDLTSCRLSVG